MADGAGKVFQFAYEFPARIGLYKPPSLLESPPANDSPSQDARQLGQQPVS